MSQTEMVIFTRSFDFLQWLLPVTNHFPKAQRFTVTHRLLNAAFDFREQLELANHQRGQQRLQSLKMADVELGKLRMYLRLSFHWQWLSIGQYQHAAKMLEEIGKLLGGWQKATTESRSP